MVQEKDAAKKRMQSIWDHAESIKKQYDDNTLETKWFVIEHTPGYNTGGYYDTDVPPKNSVVSDGFDSPEEAQEWLDRHEPDQGKSLHIWRKRLIRHIYTEWHWG